MSFGLRDKDWVEPDEKEPIKCCKCDYWDECPCGCGWGICRESEDFMHKDDGCY